MAAGLETVPGPVANGAAAAAEHGSLVVGAVMPLAQGRGGAEQMFLDLCRHRAHTRVAWRVAFLDDGDLVDAVRDLGVPTRVIPRGHLRQPHRYAGTVAGLARWMRTERLDAVVSWMPLAHLYTGPAALAALGPGRAVWFQHGLVRFPAPALMDRVAAALPAREVWCPSRHTAAAQRRAAPRRQVRVVYPSVDLARFDPGRLPRPVGARRVLGLPVDGPLVGMVTRLEPWKGCDTFVAAAPRILARIPSARFVVVGGAHFSAPEYSAALRAQAETLGVGDRLLLAGHQTNVPLWMQAMDVVVHASRGEPFGMTVVEGMALGKPVVAAASGGPLESVRDGIDGHLVPPGNPEGLAEAVCAYLARPDEAAAFGRRARERARAFSAVAMATVVGDSLRSLF